MPAKGENSTLMFWHEGFLFVGVCVIIKINGKDEVYEKKLDLFALIESKKLRAQHIVVEHNFHIVPQDMWKDIILKDNDSIEIVSFVSGG